jgi:hypothetical protein
VSLHSNLEALIRIELFRKKTKRNNSISGGGQQRPAPQRRREHRVIKVQFLGADSRCTGCR